jgi:hypothetical protein
MTPSILEIIAHAETLLSHFLLDVDMDAHNQRSTDKTVQEYRDRLYALVDRLTEHLKAESETL